jgi:hypothetical protein
MNGDKRILRQGWSSHAGAVKRLKWWFSIPPPETIVSVASLSATILYQINSDRKHKLYNIAVVFCGPLFYLFLFFLTYKKIPYALFVINEYVHLVYFRYILFFLVFNCFFFYIQLWKFGLYFIVLSWSLPSLKSDSNHHFFRNACTKSGSFRFSQFSGCWLILFVYILIPKGAWTFGVLIVTSIWIKDISLSKQRIEWSFHNQCFILFIVSLI